MAWTVSQIARLTGVSVRTLHHYDELGLLRPSGRSEAGYRVYGAGDLERLQHVLFFRELGFALEEIARILDEPGFDVATALREQRAALVERVGRLHGLIAAVDGAIERIASGRPMEREEDMSEAFRDFDHEKFEAEAERRWGETAQWQESKHRTAAYGKEELARIKAESAEIFRELARLMETGKPASDPQAMDVAERHRQHIERWFYACSKSMHRALGEMYVTDGRFGEAMENVREGLAEYVCAAFEANAGR